MKQTEYEQKRRECWKKFWYEVSGSIDCCPGGLEAMEAAFDSAFSRAYALGKQEKKKPSLTDKEVYALESAISELESLMDGTLDEDYHKEQKIVINALKRIIKKYEKK